MPSNLTEVSEFTSPVTVPSDGDIGNANSVNGAFQALANRTKRLNDLTGSEGVKRIRKVGTLDELKGLTGMVDGDVVWYQHSWGPIFWTWYASSTATPYQNFVEQPTVGGTGRWISHLYALVLFGGASGTEPRLSTLLLPPARRITNISSAEETAIFSIPGGSVWTNLGSTAAISVTLAVGDIVSVDATAKIKNTSSQPWHTEVRAIADLSGTITQIAKATAYLPGPDQAVPLPMIGLFTATSAGSHTFKVQAQCTGTVTQSSEASNPQIRVLVIRP